MIELISGSLIERNTRIQIGSGLSLSQSSEGIPILSSTGLAVSNDPFDITATVVGGERRIRLFDKVTATKYNWEIVAQRSGGTDNALEFVPSTAVGGSTFSNPVLVLYRDGSIVEAKSTGSGNPRFRATSTDSSNYGGFEAFLGSTRIFQIEAEGSGNTYFDGRAGIYLRANALFAGGGVVSLEGGKVTVGGASPANGSLQINSGNNAGSADVYLNRATSSDLTRILYQTNNVNKWSIGLRASDDNFTLRDEINALTRMTLTTGGDVGIGTSSPNQTGVNLALTVGDIAASGNFWPTIELVGYRNADNVIADYTIFNAASSSGDKRAMILRAVRLGNNQTAGFNLILNKDGTLTSRFNVSHTGWSALAQNGSTNGGDDGSVLSMQVRPSSGKKGYLQFTEDAVADRWVIGIKNGDSKLYFATGNASSNTDRVNIDSSGNITANDFILA